MKPLPEERLLRLIRGKGRAAPAASTAPAPPASAPVMIVRAAASRPRGLRLVVAGLSAALAAELLLLILQATQPLPAVRVPAVDEPGAGAGAPAPSTDPLPSLAAGVSRPLFTAAAPRPSAGEPSRPRGAPSGAAKQLAARLTLLGVVAGDPPQAIIEDAQTKKSHFVSQGQMVVEGAVLEDVRDRQIILDLDGEKIELTL
jgi:hypothetical protein